MLARWLCVVVMLLTCLCVVVTFTHCSCAFFTRFLFDVALLVGVTLLLMPLCWGVLVWSRGCLGILFKDTKKIHDFFSTENVFWKMSKIKQQQQQRIYLTRYILYAENVRKIVQEKATDQNCLLQISYQAISSLVWAQ